MRRGFTLLEVLLVVIVIAILASMVFGLMHFVESSRIELARGRIQSLGFELSNQVAVKGFPPAMLAAAAAAIRQPEWVKDPWDNPLRYTVNGKQFKLWSCGPDGVSGTGDDIVFKKN